MGPGCIIDGRGAEFLLEKDGYKHYKCRECGLVFVWPTPSAQQLADKIYSEESGYQGDKKVEEITRPVKHIAHILDFLKPGSLLDVGCSSGEFLLAARDAGFEVWGVELNPRTARVAQARGLIVHPGTLDGARFSDGQFDVVHLGDVVEHVPDPRALVTECRRVLKNGGQLVISTPNTDCLWAWVTFGLWRWFRISWSTATPPHHLFLFNFSNLDKLLEQEGFIKQAKWFERPPRLLYELGNTHLWGKFKRDKSLENGAFLIFAFTLYSLLYAVNFALSPFLSKNFGQVGVYQKNNA